MTIEKAHEIAKEIELRVERLKRNNSGLNIIDEEVCKLEIAIANLFKKIENIKKTE